MAPVICSYLCLFHFCAHFNAGHGQNNEACKKDDVRMKKVYIVYSIFNDAKMIDFVFANREEAEALCDRKNGCVHGLTFHILGLPFIDDNYNEDGYNRKGYDHCGRDSQGFSRNGFNRDGFTPVGFHRLG